ncbi:MAG: hypothetical protein COA43_08080 [Robiginitomaculum sp.]|nr:MAG: hypothetical protein COA43_08080 [Robiginitomaculum sp.]
MKETEENLIKFPDRSEAARQLIEDEAGVWLIKLDGDEALSMEGRADLEAWLKRSPLHKKELSRQAREWEQMNVLTELSVPLGAREGKRHARPFFRKLSFPTGAPRTPVSGVLALRSMVGVFAVIAVVAMTSIFFIRPDAYMKTNGSYATNVGQQRTTELVDGSVVVLNTNSEIRVTYSKEFRSIRLLKGEVHFDVAKDPAHPFRVVTDDGVFVAIGTAFTVRLKKNIVDLTVTEGIVEFTSPILLADKNLQTQVMVIPDKGRDKTKASDAVALIHAGQSLEIRAEEVAADVPENLIVEINDVSDMEIARKLSWREGYLSFGGEPLIEVVQEINRYTDITIEITDPSLESIRIGGRFPVAKTDQMLSALEENFGLRVTRVGENKVLLSTSQ